MKQPKNFHKHKFNQIELIIHQLLVALDLDPNDPELIDTSARVAGFWDEFLGYTDNNIDTTFEVVQSDQIVMLEGIEFHSLCAHHLLPISGTATIAYIATNRVCGLSKLARVVQLYAHRLQMQENMTSQIAEHVNRLIPNNSGVAVIIDALHYCQLMRGIKSKGRMKTSALLGEFKTNVMARQELFNLIQMS